MSIRAFRSAGPVGAAFLCACALVAQERPATPPLPAEHWAYQALDRLSAAGLLHGAWLPGGRPRSTGSVAEALRVAVQRASGSDWSASFAASALERFAEEYPGPARDGGDSRPLAWHGGQRYYLNARLADGGFDGGSGAGLGAEFAFHPYRAVALVYQPELQAGGGENARLAHRRFALVGASGRWWAYAGRERHRLGGGAGGAIILGSATAFDGLVVGLEAPIRLPWIFHALGPFQGIVLASFVEADSLGPDAGFGAVRLSFAPHPRIQVGVNRTILVVAGFGDERLDGRDVLNMIVGKHTPFDDQRASLDLRVRVDLAGWPLVPYLEWGLEDSAGLDEDPAAVAGLYLPAVPGMPALTMRYEFTAFGEDVPLCGPCGSERRLWYRHRAPPRLAYATDSGVPFGHPLGGYGREHRLEAAAWSLPAGLRLAVALFARRREEGNLLYATRPGQSRGVSLEAAWRPAPWLDFEATARVENGRAGWHESLAALRIRSFH